jgi:hypothetical protein
LKVPAAAARGASNGSSAGEARSYYNRPAFYNSPPPSTLPVPKFFSAKGDEAPGSARSRPHYNRPAIYNSPVVAGEKETTVVEVEMEDVSYSLPLDLKHRLTWETGAGEHGLDEGRGV